MHSFYVYVHKTLLRFSATFLGILSSSVCFLVCEIRNVLVQLCKAEGFPTCPFSISFAVACDRIPTKLLSLSFSKQHELNQSTATTQKC